MNGHLTPKRYNAWTVYVLSTGSQIFLTFPEPIDVIKPETPSCFVLSARASSKAIS